MDGLNKLTDQNDDTALPCAQPFAPKHATAEPANAGAARARTSRNIGRKRPARRSRSESGQVLVLTAMSIVVLLGFAAMAADLGQFWSVRRKMQTAADAAAISAAIALRLKEDATAAGRSVSALNGFTDSSNSVTVAVNNPPASGPSAGNASYVEVIVTQTKSSYFLSALGYSSVNISARAVGSSTNSPACVFSLDPTASGALSVGGSSSMTLGCGALVDSSSSTALSTNGGGTLTATAIGVVGGYSGSGMTPTPKSGIAPAPDPLSYLTPPSVGGCDQTNFHASGSGTTTLNHGVYCGGIQISGSGTVIFNSGLYILDGGGLKMTGSATLSGTEVTFYNTYDGSNSYGGISLSGSAQINLSAPTSGTYEAILFYQDPTVPSSGASSSITGNSSSTFDGAIYFKTTPLSYGGNSSSSGYTLILGRTVTISGHSTVGANYSSLADGSPIRSTALYE